MFGFGGDRRDLLKAAFEKWVGKVLDDTEQRFTRQRYLRPPGALPEIGFLAACTRCNACADACPPHAIIRVRSEGGLAAGTPHIDPAVQPCIVCADMPCVTACPTGALTMPRNRWQGYRLAALTFHPERCITFQGVACGVCAGVCPVGEAALAMDGDGHPVLRAEACVGCGQCMRSCVTSPSSFSLSYLEG